MKKVGPIGLLYLIANVLSILPHIMTLMIDLWIFFSDNPVPPILYTIKGAANTFAAAANLAKTAMNMMVGMVKWQALEYATSFVDVASRTRGDWAKSGAISFFNTSMPYLQVEIANSERKLVEIVEISNRDVIDTCMVIIGDRKKCSLFKMEVKLLPS